MRRTVTLFMVLALAAAALPAPAAGKAKRQQEQAIAATLALARTDFEQRYAELGLLGSAALLGESRAARGRTGSPKAASVRSNVARTEAASGPAARTVNP